MAFLAGALVGCGVTPTQELVERDVEQAVREQTPAAPTQWETIADPGAVQAGWIQPFNDPALTALVIEAQANHRDLAAAAAPPE